MSTSCPNRNVPYVPGTTRCGLNKQFEEELLYNVTHYGLWDHLPIYADYVPIRDIIKHEKAKWKDRFGKKGMSAFPRYIVTNHFGAYCIFSRDFFPIYFDVASSYGINHILFVLLESKSPWYFSTRQSVTGIPDIRLYQMDKSKDQKHMMMGQYITSGQRSYNGFKYWLDKYTGFDAVPSYPLLISKPLLQKDVSKNKHYYQTNYEALPASSFYGFDNGSLSSSLSFDVDTMIKASAIIEDRLIAYISTGLSLLLVVVTLIKWIHKCYQRFMK
eukprot:328203_1